jgi:menaquinone-dependent protoporphyrinogen oxidase
MKGISDHPGVRFMSSVAAWGNSRTGGQVSRILVLYGSTYGQTQRVAARIAEEVEREGHSVDLVWGYQSPDGLKPSQYDGIVIAASVLMGRHQPYIREFVRRNAEQLNAMPSAFVSVCGAASGDPPRAQSYIDRFLLETGWWRPTVTRSFSGAVAYTRYSPLLRWWLKRISRSQGLPTDTSRDWDFTEWEQVERFARQFAATVSKAPRHSMARSVA